MAPGGCYRDGWSKLAARLASGSHVLVQDEIVTREYERVIKVPNGKKTIGHKIHREFPAAERETA